MKRKIAEKARERERESDQIRHLDQSFESGIVLDVEAVELDAIGPGVRPRGLQEVFDLVVVDVQGQHLVRRLRYQLLAQVRPYEPPGTDHAYRHCLYRLPVQIYPRHRHSYSVSL